MEQNELISEAKVREILDPHSKKLNSIYPRAWEAWEIAMKCMSQIPIAGTSVTPRSRASLVHDFATGFARHEFEGVEGVEPIDVHGFLTVVFEDTIVIRFKKFRNKGMKTSSIPTNQQRKFALQDPLPGMSGDLTNLVAGYLLDDLQTSVSMAAITCSVGSDLQWVIDITDEGWDADFAQPVQPDSPSGPRVTSAEESQGDTVEDSGE